MARVIAFMFFCVAVILFYQFDGGAQNKTRLIKASSIIAVADLNTITPLSGPGICSAKGYAYRVDGVTVGSVKGAPPKYLVLYTGKG